MSKNKFYTEGRGPTRKVRGPMEPTSLGRKRAARSIGSGRQAMQQAHAASPNGGYPRRSPVAMTYHERTGYPVLHLSKSSRQYIMVRKKGGGVKRLYMDTEEFKQEVTVHRNPCGPTVARGNPSEYWFFKNRQAAHNKAERLREGGRKARVTPTTAIDKEFMGDEYEYKVQVKRPSNNKRPSEAARRMPGFEARARWASKAAYARRR